MEARQLSIWDNIALENGYRFLTVLEFEEALRQFDSVLKSGTGNRETIQKVIEACRYWKTRIQYQPEKQASAYPMENLLADYSGYPFAPEMTAFKKTLLRHIVERMLRETKLRFEAVETAFDLLLDLKDYVLAENLISQYIHHYPENRISLYFLAQVQWLNGDHTDANKNYIRALLYCPEKLPESRIENSKLKDLIISCGPSMAPAFGWVRDFLPLIPLSDEIKARDAEHLKAIESYHLLYKANKAVMNNDIKSCVHYRAQLKTQSPQLYDEYFDLLKQRK